MPGSFTISKMNKDNVLSHIRIDYVPQRGFSLMVQHKSAAGTAAEHNKEEVSVFLVLVCVGVWVCVCGCVGVGFICLCTRVHMGVLMCAYGYHVHACVGAKFGVCLFVCKNICSAQKHVLLLIDTCMFCC